MIVDLKESWLRALTGVAKGLDAEVTTLEDVWPDDAGNEKDLDPVAVVAGKKRMKVMIIRRAVAREFAMTPRPDLVASATTSCTAAILVTTSAYMQAAEEDIAFDHVAAFMSTHGVEWRRVAPQFFVNAERPLAGENHVDDMHMVGEWTSRPRFLNGQARVMGMKVPDHVNSLKPQGIIPDVALDVEWL